MGITEQARIILDAAEYVGKEAALQALAFANQQGLELLHYNPVADTWQLSDGEIYSTNLILRQNK